MSCVLTKDDVASARWKAAVPFFLVFFLSCTVFIAAFTYGMRRQLAGAELAETEQLLAAYLQSNRAAPLQFGGGGSAAFGARERLGGLAFIRISRGHDRLLLTGDNIPPTLFQELLHLDQQTTAPWLKLPGNSGETVWTVVTRSLDTGVVIQAGKQSIDSYHRYRAFFRLAVIAAGGGCMLSLAASLLCVKRMVSPLIQLRKELETLMEEGREQLLPEGKSDRERDELYRQVNRLIRQNRRLVSEMQGSLDNVAHDLRTPMTRLRSVAEFGLREDSDSERLRESLADCLEESERVLAMLRIMMSVAEAETGTIQLEYERLDLGESIDEMVSLYEYVAEERRISVTTDLGRGLYIDADRTRIAQVWANLLDNGVKYGKEGGWITVEAIPSGDEVCVRFRDNGMGISEAEQPRIWERLYRGDRSRSQQGLGLGLNFVKAIVETHDGTVHVDSVLHHGSCFTVQLPRAQESVAEELKEKSQTSGEWSENRTSGM